MFHYLLNEIIFIRKIRTVLILYKENLSPLKQNTSSHQSAYISNIHVGQYVTLCAIWYHLYKSKNVKNTHGWVPPFTNLLKVTLFHVCFHVFKIILNCTNGTKSLNRSHIDWKNHGSSASFCFIYLTNMNYDTNLLKSHSKIHFDLTCNSIFPPFLDKNFELMQWCSLSVNQKHSMQAMIKLT